MKYIIDIPNEMVIKSPLKGMTLGIAMMETSTQKQFIVPTNIPLISYIEPQKWIPFHKRELTEEEQEMYPEWSHWLDCELPEDGDEILISSPTWGVYKDTFNNGGSDGCYLEGCEEIDDGMAWMPLPEPWNEEE